MSYIGSDSLMQSKEKAKYTPGLQLRDLQGSLSENLSGTWWTEDGISTTKIKEEVHKKINPKELTNEELEFII